MIGDHQQLRAKYYQNLRNNYWGGDKGDGGNYDIL
jgi:hypothetical protein